VNVLWRETNVLQHFLGTRTRKIFAARVEDQFVFMFGCQGLLLQQIPAAFVHEKTNGMVDGFKEVFTPLAIARMPEAGDQDSAWPGLIVGMDRASCHYDQVPAAGASRLLDPWLRFGDCFEIRFRLVKPEFGGRRKIAHTLSVTTFSAQADHTAVFMVRER
jgi:hypothetical protein